MKKIIIVKILSGERPSKTRTANPKQPNSPLPSGEGGWGIGFIELTKLY